MSTPGTFAERPSSRRPRRQPRSRPRPRWADRSPRSITSPRRWLGCRTCTEGRMGDSNTQKALRALLAPAASLEHALQQLLTERNVNTAIGAQLDLIGKIVGRPRAGVADDEIYRRYIR